MPDTLAESVASEVRAGMARSKRTSLALAEHLGVSHAYVSRRLNGHLPFTLDDLEKIAAFLEVPVASLLHERAA